MEDCHHVQVYIIGDELIVKKTKGNGTVKGICLQDSCPQEIVGAKPLSRITYFWLGSIIQIDFEGNSAFQWVLS